MERIQISVWGWKTRDGLEFMHEANALTHEASLAGAMSGTILEEDLEHESTPRVDHARAVMEDAEHITAAPTVPSAEDCHFFKRWNIVCCGVCVYCKRYNHAPGEVVKAG